MKQLIRSVKNPGKFALAFASILICQCAFATDLVWIGGTGNWNAAGNWLPSQLPTAADNVFITNNGTYTVTVPAGTTATAGALIVGGVTGGQTLAVDRATLTLNGATIINANGTLTPLVAQSVVNGAGNLTINGALSWLNGAISGAGALIVNPGGSLAIGNAGVTLGRTLNNSGAATWSGGNLTISAGVSLNNLAGGTFDITADGRLMGLTNTPVNNSGLFRQLAGAAGTVVTAPVNNSGTLQVLASTLNLNLGGAHSGTISNASGATINLGGGNHVLSSSSFVTGAGILSVSGGATTLNVAGTFDTNGSALSVSAGIVTLSSGSVVSGTTFSVGGAGGVLLFNTTSPVEALSLNAGTLGGISPIVVTGLLSLGGGTVTNSSVTASGGLNINGNVTLNGVSLVNPAIATWSAGNIVGLNGAVISNLSGAIFNNTFDGLVSVGSGATPTFFNAGLFQKSGGTALAGTTTINFQFFNTGTVEIQTNTLRYALNQQTSGLTLVDGGSLAAQAQPLQFLGGSLVATGAVTVANNQNLINSASFSPGLPLGEVDISGNYQQTASGVLNIALGGYSAGINFDLITVTAGGAGGIASLGGALDVTLTNGFSPTNGATFTFLTASSRVGSFTTFNYPSNQIGMQLILGPTSATVKVTNLKPVVANPITNPASITYGAPFNFQFAANTFTDPDNDTLTYSTSGMPSGVNFVPATRTFSGTPTQAGVFVVAVVANDGGTPNLTATNFFNITVNPAPLAIAAQPQTKIYGAVDPGLTFLVTGLQLSDTPETVLSGTLNRSPGETVAGGPYAITQGTLAANQNYTIGFTSNALTISPATLNVTAQPQGKVFGAADPALTFSVSGLQFTDTQSAVLAGALARAPGESVAGNPYAVTQGNLTANSNYAINFTSSTFLISKAALSVTADPQTKIYGASDPSFTVSYNGFVTGDSAASLGGALSTTRAPGENVGPYSITPGGLTSPNYSIAFNPGTLTVTKAPLSVTADPKTKPYGAADPALTYAVSGLQLSDTAVGVLSGNLTRAPGETVAGGPYAITQGTLAPNGNYTINFTSNTLTIAKVALSVTADAKTKIYGAADPAFTVTYSGFVSNESATALGGTLSFVRAPGENVGNYSITPAGQTSGNYAITFNPGSLDITKAPLTITADAKSKTYGTVDPNFTAAYSAFANGESSAVLGGSLVFSRVPGENAGSYLITPSGQTSANYDITFNTGSLVINKAPLSVTADSKIKTFGAVDPAFTATFSGFVKSETNSVLQGTLTLSRVTGETVGSYLITPGGLTGANYAITFNTGTLTIAAPAPTLLPLAFAGTNAVISWASISNGAYRVQFIPDLSTTNWTDLPGDITATGSQSSKSDARTNGNRFYRVRVLP